MAFAQALHCFFRYFDIIDAYDQGIIAEHTVLQVSAAMIHGVWRQGNEQRLNSRVYAL